MNPLLTKCNTIADILVDKFKVSGVEQKEHYANLLKEFHSLVDKIERELAFLSLDKKEYSTKLQRLHADVIVFENHHIVPLQPKTDNQLVAEIKPFQRFIRDRVRQVKDGFPMVKGEKVSIKELSKSYKRWCIVNEIKNLPLTVFESYCEIEFGDSKGKKVYQDVRVFLEEEDVEEFDKEFGIQ